MPTRQAQRHAKILPSQEAQQQEERAFCAAKERTEGSEDDGPVVPNRNRVYTRYGPYLRYVPFIHSQ